MVRVLLLIFTTLYILLSTTLIANNTSSIYDNFELGNNLNIDSSEYKKGDVDKIRIKLKSFIFTPKIEKSRVKKDTIYPFTILYNKDIDKELYEDLQRRIVEGIRNKYSEYGIYVIDKIRVKLVGILAATKLRSINEQVEEDLRDIKAKCAPIFKELESIERNK